MGGYSGVGQALSHAGFGRSVLTKGGFVSVTVIYC